VQVAEARNSQGDKSHSCEIQKAFNDQVLIHTGRSQLCWFNRMFGMPQEKLMRQVLQT